MYLSRVVGPFGKQIRLKLFDSLRGFLLSPHKLALLALRQKAVFDHAHQRLERSGLLPHDV